MDIILTKRPKNVTLITGFPGFGLVGTITTEFLTNHLKCEEIGQIIIKDSSPVVAIHTEKLIKPITLFYNKEHNIVIIHSISPGTRVEWKISEAIEEISKKLQVKQLISVEGVMSQVQPTENVFFHSNKQDIASKLEKAGLLKMKEGIVIGVTAALLTKGFPSFVSLFAETHTDLPDSRASAKIIKALDAYLGLKVDYVPLIKQADLFEAKIKHVIEQGQVAAEAKQKSQEENYFG